MRHKAQASHLHIYFRYIVAFTVTHKKISRKDVILLNDVNPKEYLLKLQRLNANINQKIAELDSLRLMCTSIKSPSFDSDKVQTGGSGDAPFVRQIEKIMLLQSEINAEIDRFVDEKHTIINQIQQLSDSRYIEILHKRYVEFKRLEVVAVEMNYSYQYTIELHGHALKAFKNILLKTYMEQM